MLDKLLSFNAQSVNPLILENTLTIRKKVVDDIEAKCITKTLAGTTYQSLIIAPRGSGKTHIIKVLYHRLKDNNKINKKIIIAYMQEDPIGIANFTDLLLAILNSFELDVEKTEFIQNKIYKASSITNKTEQINAIKETLLEIVGKLKIILLIENFNKILKSFGKSEQAKLRDFIHQYNNISIIATSQSLIKVLNDSTYPFYNFFDVRQLEKLNFEQAVELIKAIAKTEENDDLLSEISKPQFMSKLKAIYELTAGNHRLLVTFYNFLKAEYKSDLSVTFIKTMNDLKPYYEQFINNLSAQQQKVINYLSSKRKAVKGKEIAQFCFMNKTTLSKQTSLLYQMGMIDKKKEGKDSYYELKEPLMRISFEIAQNRNGFAKLFVDFLSNYYESKSIRKQYYKYKYGAKFQSTDIKVKYIQEAKMFELALPLEIKENKKIYDKILADVKSIDELKEKIETLDEDALREKIMAFKNFYQRFNFEPKEFAKLVLGSISLTIEEKNELINTLPRLNEEQFKRLGNLFEDEKIKFTNLYGEELYNQIIFYVNKGIEKPLSNIQILNKIDEKLGSSMNAKTFKKLADVYEELKDYKNAIKNYDKAIKLHSKNADFYNNLGIAYRKLKDYKTAIKNYNKAIRLQPKNADFYFNLGIVYGNLKDYKTAIKKFNKAIKLQPEDADFYFNLGVAFRYLKDYKAAIKNYNKAIKLQPENAYFYNNLGVGYGNLKNYKKAINNYNKAIKLKPENADYYNNLGIAYSNLKDYKTAIENIIKAIKLQPKNAVFYNNLGMVYGNLKDYKTAIKNYNKAIKLQPKNASFYNNLGGVYLHFNKIEKAFENFKESIKLNPENIYVKFSLLGVYIRSNDLEKSKSVFVENILLADDNLIIDALNEDIINNMFKYGSVFFMKEFLTFVVDTLKENNKVNLLLNNFSKNLFDILIHIEDYDLERLNTISSLLKTVLKEYPAHIIPLKLFDVGIQYLKNNEKTALFNLTKEERKVFNEFIIDKRNKISH